MKIIGSSILYMVLGLALGAAGIHFQTWQFWMIMCIVLLIDVWSYITAN